MRRTIHGARTRGGSVAKLTNNTLIFGIMGGLAPMRNIRASTHVGYRVGDARMHQDIPLDPKRGFAYMMGQNPMGKYMLSRNPQCAGGIGRMASTSSRGAYTTPTRGKKVFIPPVAPKSLGALLVSVTGHKFTTNDALSEAVYMWISDKTSAATTYGDISTWDTSLITDMSGLFKGYATFNDDISNWDTTKVTNMSEMFYGAYYFNQDLGWDTSSVADMSYMFSRSGLWGGVGDWITSSVTNMEQMFSDTMYFKEYIGNWDTSSVTNMKNMFSGATAFNNGKEKGMQGSPMNWDTSSVHDMSGMFGGATAFNGDIGNWCTSSVHDMSDMFNDAVAFNGDITSWDTHNVHDMSAMFWGAEAFNQDIGSWDTESVLNMSYMFNGARAFNGDIGRSDPQSVTDMSYMFYGATAFNQDLKSSIWRGRTQNVSKCCNFSTNSGLDPNNIPHFPHCSPTASCS